MLRGKGTKSHFTLVAVIIDASTKLSVPNYSPSDRSELKSCWRFPEIYDAPLSDLQQNYEHSSLIIYSTPQNC
jgi:hypothetical protein